MLSSFLSSSYSLTYHHLFYSWTLIFFYFFFVIFHRFVKEEGTKNKFFLSWNIKIPSLCFLVSAQSGFSFPFFPTGTCTSLYYFPSNLDLVHSFLRIKLALLVHFHWPFCSKFSSRKYITSQWCFCCKNPIGGCFFSFSSFSFTAAPATPQNPWTVRTQAVFALLSWPSSLDRTTHLLWFKACLMFCLVTSQLKAPVGVTCS